MRKPITTMALAACLTMPVMAQVAGTGGPRGGGAAPRLNPTPPSGTAPGRPAAATRSGNRPVSPAPGDRQVNPAAVAPEPIPVDRLEGPKIPLPTGPIEPFLLLKEHGPFMILAHTFRGPDCTRFALALVQELRRDYQLPAYIFYLKVHPGGRSNVYEIPPTAPPEIHDHENMTPPELYRIYDEAAVLVGHAQSIDEANKLLHRVKKIHPKCIDGLPTIWGHRRGKGLHRALITQNPLVASQYLYPGHGPRGHHKDDTPGTLPVKAGAAFDPMIAPVALFERRKMDPLVKRINGGPRSLFRCRGAYSLQVAEFSGRTVPIIGIDQHVAPSLGTQAINNDLRKSPLMTAADDAERLAEGLAKCKSLGGFQPYVFHDRSSSRVYLGSFTGPNDPALGRLRKALPEISNEMIRKQYSRLFLVEQMLTPVPRPD